MSGGHRRSCLRCGRAGAHPTVLWAQRRDRVFLTIDLPNAESPKVNLKDEGTLSFSAMAGPVDDQHKYAVELEFMYPVNAKDSKISVGPRNVVVMVMKTEEVRGRWSLVAAAAAVLLAVVALRAAYVVISSKRTVFYFRLPPAPSQKSCGCRDADCLPRRRLSLQRGAAREEVQPPSATGSIHKTPKKKKKLCQLNKKNNITWAPFPSIPLPARLIISHVKYLYKSLCAHHHHRACLP